MNNRKQQLLEEKARIDLELEKLESIPDWDKMSTEEIDTLISTKDLDQWFSWSKCPVGTLLSIEDNFIPKDQVLKDLGSLILFIKQRDLKLIVYLIRRIAKNYIIEIAKAKRSPPFYYETIESALEYVKKRNLI